MIVLVHGLSASSRWWDGVVPLLGQRPVRVVDLPRTPGRGAAALAAELEPHAPAILVGHSLGGLIAAQVAAARPELVRALILVCPAGAPGRPLRAYAGGLARTLAFAQPALLRAVVRGALRAGPFGLALGAHYATRQRFEGSISAPTLLVWGERDTLLPVEMGKEWLAAIPGAQLVVIPGAGHVPMLELPSTFAQIVLDFLDGLEDGAGV